MDFGIFYFSATGITKIISKEIGRSLKQKGHTIHIKNIIACLFLYSIVSSNVDNRIL